MEEEDEGRRLVKKRSMDERVAASPPLHIDVVNESIPYMSNARQDR